MYRDRMVYFVLIVLTIMMGVASRLLPGLMPPMLGKYPGDVLWALMVFLIWGWLLARSPSALVLVLAVITALAVEFLKLSQDPWLVHARQTSWGNWVFGHVFSWRNLVAYAIGIGLGLVMEMLLLRHEDAD